ncbi:hypothetical protein CVV38_02810 [Candidatus Peregrinibacteria bacterium HGW-Peregrinibacteria-1]|jgi:uncharacterized membrane protein YgcG|nr:MAG: hypothetical protein CVV38_02810 [Candidatus Peregrinibacteria bacterium HGW-Peregrinibacteria-1]
MNNANFRLWSGFIGLFVAMTFLVVGGSGVAASEEYRSEKISSFHSDIEILESGEIVVSEEILYDFGSFERQGIIREIPYSYIDNGESVSLSIDIIDVVDENGVSYDYEILKNDYENLRSIGLRIGTPGYYIDGEHHYVLKYSVKGAINTFEDFNELAWNVTGNEWEVPIDSASARVFFESMVPSSYESYVCYSGYYGLETSYCEASKEGDAFLFSAKELTSAQGLTVAVGFDEALAKAAGILNVALKLPTGEDDGGYIGGLVSIDGESENFVPPHSFRLLAGEHALSAFRHGYKNERVLVDIGAGESKDLVVELKESLVYKFFDGVLPLFILVFLLGRILTDWLRNGKDAVARRIVVPEYVAPKVDKKYLSAGELGVVIDQVAHLHDITATIIELANRGYLKLVKPEKSKDFVFEKVKSIGANDEVADYQREVFKGIFGEDQSKKTVQMKDLQGSFSTKLRIIKSKLYGQVVDNGYFKTDPDKVREKYYVYGAIYIIFGGIISFLLAMISGFFWYFPVMITVGLVYVMFAKWMPKKTSRGAEAYSRAMGFKKFLQRVEKKRLERMYGPEQYEEVFVNFLPYAIIFGIEKRWVKVFKGLMIEPPKWFSGADFVVFANSFDRFSSKAERAYQPAVQYRSGGSSSGGAWSSSGGSFSGGGGFSGGGFGGGGGSSW